MALHSFSLFPKRSLGVDIGTSFLKVVELSRWGVRTRLKNYGEIPAAALYDKPFRTFEKNTLLLSSEDIARALRAIMEEAHIETKEAVFSIPDFSSFFTNFKLPPMTKEEVPDAIRYEARRHIPLPIAEVSFDWQIVQGKPEGDEPFHVLMVAVPNEVLNQYRTIAKLANLKLIALEPEAFGALRSGVGEDNEPLVLMDVGAQSTNLSVVERRQVHISHSMDTAGNSFTARIAESLGVDYEEAEKRKLEKGLRDEQQKRVLSPLLDLLVFEARKIASQYEERDNIKKIKTLLLGGASTQLPGFREYAQEKLGWKVQFVDPFRNVWYPPLLEEVIRGMGPSYAVAVGMALRQIQ
ncbi:MAG: type IV pilus assembly protein PilM [Patescibacteria group bacterium]